MKFFLKLKHWQLFLIAFAIPFCLYIGTFLTAIFYYEEPFLLFKFFPFIIALFMFGQYGWMFSVARLLNARVPSVAKLRLGSFYFFFFFPILYIAIFSAMISWFMFDMAEASPLFPILFLCVIPIHLFAMFCMFYCIYFVAKTIKSVELGREAVLNDYIGEFFMIWFFAFGLWLLQPRINSIKNE